MNRLAVVLLVLALSVAACSGDDADPAPEASSSAAPAASALDDDGGVQVWDLTGEPSDAALGIETGEPSVDYASPEPRPVRFELDGGSLQLELSDLTFYHPEGDTYAFLSRSTEVPADELSTTYRDLLRQLDLDEATADEFDAELADAPTDEPGQVAVSHPDEIRFGDWTLALSVAISPAVGTGVVTVSGGYKPLGAA